MQRAALTYFYEGDQSYVKGNALSCKLNGIRTGPGPNDVLRAAAHTVNDLESRSVSVKGSDWKSGQPADRASITVSILRSEYLLNLAVAINTIRSSAKRNSKATQTRTRASRKTTYIRILTPSRTLGSWVRKKVSHKMDSKSTTWTLQLLAIICSRPSHMSSLTCQRSQLMSWTR